MNSTMLSKTFALAAQGNAGDILLIAFSLALIPLFFYFIFIFMSPKLWIAAKLTNTPVSFIEIIGMRFRRVPPEKIVHPMITASQVGIDVSCKALEAHYLAGGDPEKIVIALLIAKKADLELDFNQACAVDLTPGQDIVEIVRETAEKKEQ